MNRSGRLTCASTCLRIEVSTTGVQYCKMLLEMHHDGDRRCRFVSCIWRMRRPTRRRSLMTARSRFGFSCFLHRWCLSGRGHVNCQRKSRISLSLRVDFQELCTRHSVESNSLLSYDDDNSGGGNDDVYGDVVVFVGGGNGGGQSALSRSNAASANSLRSHMSSSCKQLLKIAYSI
jgi:hypothetical protein